MVKKSIPAARRQQILNWLGEEGSLSITELEERLAVSHMTIHRDLDLLVKQGLISKVRGGALINNAQDEQWRDSRSCAMCSMNVTRRLEFRIMHHGKPHLSACCPHCGLMLLPGIPEVASALARDYLYGHMVNVYQAYYVIASEVSLCCEPTVLCFAKIVDAEKFSQGFGGQVMHFSQAVTYLTASHRHGHQ